MAQIVIQLFAGRRGDKSDPIRVLRSEHFDPTQPPNFHYLDSIFPRGGWIGIAVDGDDQFTPGTMKGPKEGFCFTRDQGIWLRLIFKVGGSERYSQELVIHSFRGLPSASRRRSTVANGYTDSSVLRRINEAEGAWDLNLFHHQGLVSCGVELGSFKRDLVSFQKPSAPFASRTRWPSGTPPTAMMDAILSVTPALEELQYIRFLGRCKDMQPAPASPAVADPAIQAAPEISASEELPDLAGLGLAE
jgi:hypothetical protein